MTHETYIKKLKSHLGKLPQGDLDEFISEINIHFQEGIKSGRKEETIAHALGHPKRLAASLLLEYDINQLSENNQSINKFFIIVRMIGIGLKNLIVAPFLLAIGLLVFSGYLLVFSFYLFGGTAMIAPILHAIEPTLVSPGPFPVLGLPIVGLIVLFISKKLHQLLSKYTSGIIAYLIKYVKVDYKKLTL